MIKLMKDIYTVLEFIEGALRMDEIVNFKMEDTGDIIRFSIQRGHHNILCEEIAKVDDDTLRTIYAGITAKFGHKMNIGATTHDFKGGNVVWRLAPVIGNNTLVEFISEHEKDQAWFYEELNKEAKEKGLV